MLCINFQSYTSNKFNLCMIDGSTIERKQERDLGNAKKKKNTF